MEISVLTKGNRDDYLSLTDIASYKSDNPKAVIQNRMRNRNTLEFLGVWEELHNPGFKGLEFDAFRSEAGLNSFTMSPTKWISATNAIGIKVKRGRYDGGTFAHVDIAFEFASWISPEFKLYIIKDYQRLKSDENSRLSLEWERASPVFQDQLPITHRCHQREYRAGRYQHDSSWLRICDRGRHAERRSVWLHGQRMARCKSGNCREYLRPSDTQPIGSLGEHGEHERRANQGGHGAR